MNPDAMYLGGWCWFFDRHAVTAFHQFDLAVIA